jgi:hypothetical protein
MRKCRTNGLNRPRHGSCSYRVTDASRKARKPNPRRSK